MILCLLIMKQEKQPILLASNGLKSMKNMYFWISSNTHSIKIEVPLVMTIGLRITLDLLVMTCYLKKIKLSLISLEQMVWLIKTEMWLTSILIQIPKISMIIKFSIETFGDSFIKDMVGTKSKDIMQPWGPILHIQQQNKNSNPSKCNS